MQILSGHVSPETAYVVDDYPYGFRLRCSIRYWLEYTPKRGFRLWSQTSNPKRGNVWNKPRASTYAKLGGCMFLNSEGHVNWAGLTEYGGAQEAQNFVDTYGAGIPAAGLPITKAWLASKRAYEGARKEGDPLSVGVAEARLAFAKAFKAASAGAEG